MIRHLFSLTSLTVAASSAAAQYPAGCWPYYPPPIVVCCPPAACVPCPPAVATVLPGKPAEPKTPTIVPERMPEKDQPKKETTSEPLGTPREFATPKPAEATPEPKSESKTDVTPTSGTAPVIPTLAIPAPAVPMTPPKEPTPPAPKAQDPEPVAKPSLPSFEFTPPPAELPKATDPVPPLPARPAKGVTSKSEEKAKVPSALPAFDLEFPKPAQPVEANKPVVAKASPLSNEREVRFDVYPVDGPTPATPAAMRTVGFINKSDRDLLLTIDGKMVTLPMKNVLRADLPAAFKWQVGGGVEQNLTVPPTAPGVDVVIRK